MINVIIIITRVFGIKFVFSVFDSTTAFLFTVSGLCLSLLHLPSSLSLSLPPSSISLSLPPPSLSLPLSLPPLSLSLSLSLS